MNTTELVAAFRQDVIDLAEPYLWSDAEILRYANDAQTMFCRAGAGISDVLTITVPANTLFVPIPSTVWKLRGITRDYDGREVKIVNYEDSQSIAASQIRLDERFGPLVCVVVGLKDNYLRVVAKQSLETSLTAVVYRLPNTPLTALGQSLEIDAIHHLHLLWWMKFLAYSKQDSETFEKARADDCQSQFLIYCKQSREEREQKEHKYRTVRYGGL